MASEFAKAYNSFSGVDIKVVAGSQVLGEVQAISYSCTREKAPIYTMGDPNPRAFARGKRGIAGTLIFMQFDSHPLVGHEDDASKLGSQSANMYQADVDELRLPKGAAEQPSTGVTSSNLSSTSGKQASTTVQNAYGPLKDITLDQEKRAAFYADQILPFDITMAAANEYGALAVMRIFGIELLNEGYGISIDDIVSEHQFTYVARHVVPWTSLGRNPDIGLPAV